MSTCILFDLRPKIRFGDYLSLSEDNEAIEPKLILKRTAKDTSSMDKVRQIPATTRTQVGWHVVSVGFTVVCVVL